MKYHKKLIGKIIHALLLLLLLLNFSVGKICFFNLSSKNNKFAKNVLAYLSEAFWTIYSRTIKYLKFNSSIRTIKMKKVEFHKDTELTIKNIKGFMKRKVVISGTSAKINVPKEYLGYETYLVILENGIKKRGKDSSRRIEGSKRRE